MHFPSAPTYCFPTIPSSLPTVASDKTFFIAAVLAMKNSRAVVLSGALSALALMTVLR